MKKLSKIVFILTIVIMYSCQQDEMKTNNTNLNTFSMTLDGNSWRPSVIDSCTKTFQCNMSSLDDDYFYKVEAYRDPSLIANLESENFFEMQIMGVNDIGTFAINGGHEDFQSYARLTINDITGKRRYQNKKDGESFTVAVTEIFTSETSLLRGIGGSFSGFLYNLDNPEDSIKIENGTFVFKKINWYNFNQCKEW